MNPVPYPYRFGTISPGAIPRAISPAAFVLERTPESRPVLPRPADGGILVNGL